MKQGSNNHPYVGVVSDQKFFGKIFMMCWRGAGRYFAKAPAGSVKSPYNSCKTSILHTPDQSACFLGEWISTGRVLFLQGNPDSYSSLAIDIFLNRVVP